MQRFLIMWAGLTMALLSNSSILTAQITYSKLYNAGNFQEGAEGPGGKIYLLASRTDNQGFSPQNIVLCTDPWGEPEWQVALGGPNLSGSSYNNVSVSDFGQIYVGVFGDSLPNDRAVFCLDESGNLQWAVESPVLWMPEATRDGGAIVSGRAGNFGYFHKLDSNGTLEWGQQVIYSDQLVPPRIIEIPDGYLAATTVTRDMAGTPVGYIILTKFGPNGNLLWTYELSSPNHSIATSKHYLTPDTNIVLRFGQRDLTVPGSEFEFGAIQIDTAGNVNWGVVVPGVKSDVDFQMADDGSVGFISLQSPSGNFTGTLLQIDANGNPLLWTDLGESMGNTGLYVQGNFPMLIGPDLFGTPSDYMASKTLPNSPRMNCSFSSSFTINSVTPTLTRSNYSVVANPSSQVNPLSIAVTPDPFTVTTLCDSCGADAAFSSSSNALNVNFADQSAGNIGTWTWDFGDGTTSTAANPNHTFPSPGSYNVCLTVEEGRCVDSICQTVSVVATGTVDPAATLQVLVYPQPARDAVVLDLRHVERAQGPVGAKLFSPLGVLVGEWETVQSGTRIDVRGLPGGMYRLVLEQGGRRQVQTVVKQ